MIEQKIRTYEKHPYDGIAPEFPICKKSPWERLQIWNGLIPDVTVRYESLDIPKNIVSDTLREIPRLSQLYRKKTGREGLSKENVIWLRHICHGELFQIGSLQYQLFRMVYLDEEGCGDAYMQFDCSVKARLPQGTPVINVHIPTGTDLSKEAVAESLALAKAFFQMRFPDAKAFVCYSWLLYPGMLELLPAYSNIAAFASNFQIIGQVSDPYGSDAVKRIYGRRYPRKAWYPKETQLQRNAIGNFSKLGMGCGLIEIS